MSTQGVEAGTAAQRMEALGRLAGGVAHDFNNLLMVISGHAELLAHSVAKDAQAREAAQTILDATARAGSLTRQLLLFSRRQGGEPRDLAIVVAVRGLESTLRRLLPAGVVLRIETEDASLIARVDPGQLELAVLNLVTNARDAMPEGGTITVTVQGVTEWRFVDASGDRAPAGDYVRLAITDTGRGMDEPFRSRIFEPFLTLRPTGEVYLPLVGTGARLAPNQLPSAAGHETVRLAEGDAVVRAPWHRADDPAGGIDVRTGLGVGTNPSSEGRNR